MLTVKLAVVYAYYADDNALIGIPIIINLHNFTNSGFFGFPMLMHRLSSLFC